ncbi:MAG: FG-GAP repeat domain-containing protein [Flavobacteriales bacterium]
MTLRLLFPALLAALSTLSHAQEVPPSWVPGTWPVVLDEVALSNPWVGGLTAPQWSAFDADLDGDDDLFAFDRDGSRVLMFERIPGEDLTLRWDWTEGWPDMVDWCLLRDYNCDGKPDIFTSHQNGIRVFTNTTQPGEGPSFDPDPVTLFATFDLIGSDPSDLPVICLGMDLPAIMDHDDDGDLDIITFTETASTLYRFEGQTPCGLDLECTNRCYGMLAEAAENNALFIGNDFECSFNVENPGMVVSDVSRTGLHAGGALTSLQLEPGGPKDLIISDITYPEALAVVLEVGPSSLDSATYVDPTFPSNLYGDQAVNLARFPAAFHLDVDQDGVRDLLFSPNTPLETNDDESVHFFRNTGTEDEPAWQFITDTYLQDGMIDLGRGAYPSFHDFDGDGLLDLAVANKERYEGVDQTPAAVAVFRNAGTATEPQFDLVDLDWIALADFQIESPCPAFGDLDGDGDLDVLVGDELGRIHEFTNVAPAGAWPEFTLTALSIPEDGSGEAIDVGQFATPQLHDMDGDGDLDMVVGEKNGTLTLFERTSVGSWSKYVSPIHGENWGNILVDNLLGINGYSVPALTPTSEGLRVFVANETGTVQDFGLASDNWDAELLEVNDAVFGGREGFRCAAAIADVDNDGFLDALVGIQNGGLLSYSSSTDTVIVDAGSLPGWEWQLMPNPGRDAFRWRSAQPWSGELTAWSVTGKKVGHVVVQGQREGAMETSAWAPGTYVIRPVHTPGNSKGVPMGTPLTWIKLPE